MINNNLQIDSTSSPEDEVEVEIQKDYVGRKTLYIHVNGTTIARITRIFPDMLSFADSDGDIWVRKEKNK